MPLNSQLFDKLWITFHCFWCDSLTSNSEIRLSLENILLQSAKKWLTYVAVMIEKTNGFPNYFCVIVALCVLALSWKKIFPIEASSAHINYTFINIFNPCTYKFKFSCLRFTDSKCIIPRYSYITHITFFQELFLSFISLFLWTLLLLMYCHQRLCLRNVSYLSGVKGKVSLWINAPLSYFCSERIECNISLPFIFNCRHKVDWNLKSFLLSD